MLIAVSVHQRFAFIVVAVYGQAVADPTDADVIRTVQRDAVPGQRAIGGGELAAARAGVGSAPLHLNVDRVVLANRYADSQARFIGEPLFCRSNLEAPRTQAG